MTTSKTMVDKLTAIRAQMKEHNVDAYYIPSEDAHQSEYIAPWDGRRAFISGFTGSAGSAIITMDRAALWTDGRYYLQAEKQLDPNWELMRDGLEKTPKKHEWLISNCKNEKSFFLGIDPMLVSFDESKKLGDLFKDKQIYLKPLKENLVDKIWTDRPKPTYQPIQHLDVKFSGKPAGEKIKTLVEKYLNKDNYEAMVISELDEIAWLFNLRGSDISYNPVFFAYSIVFKDGNSIIYLANHEKSDILDNLKQEITTNPPKIAPYPQIFTDLQVANYKQQEKKILVSKHCNMALVEALGGVDTVAIKESPIAIEKSIKNEVEIRGFRECHKRDGAAIVKYFAWLQHQLNQGVQLDEVDGADQLEKFRSLGEYFVGLSFDTISGIGPNGAVIHYKPAKPQASLLTKDKVYLCDSGAQYRDGTTDTTRTVHFGTPTSFEKEAFTRVLKGVIALDSAKFPKGTTGIQLDTLARMDLWKVGLNYRHGTGHGVGHFLNVHEGPHSISSRRGSSDESLKAGMTVTDEPGYYHDGFFGIRIENILIVQPANHIKYSFGGEGNWLEFENVTMVPIDINLIDISLLSSEEIKWINNYHERVRMELTNLLVGDKLALDYLIKSTTPI